MTSLAAWIAVDSRSPSSFYLASDSRISWGESKYCDDGRKLFGCRNYPHIFGYCGDVLFPSLILGQIIDLIDNDLLFTPFDNPRIMQDKIVMIIKESFAKLPPQERRAFTILHTLRENSGMPSVFHLWKLSFDHHSRWTNELVPLQEESAHILGIGSGGKTINIFNTAWKKTEIGRTSRSMFSAFCDALESKRDKFTGGAPQLVGLYRTGGAESFGIIYKGQRFLMGLPVAENNTLDLVEWRNCLFERCDWRTMERLKGAQRHARPRSRKH